MLTAEREPDPLEMVAPGDIVTHKKWPEATKVEWKSGDLLTKAKKMLLWCNDQGYDDCLNERAQRIEEVIVILEGEIKKRGKGARK
jgi:hypothetical protein